MGREGGVQVSDIKIGDRVRRTVSCGWSPCDFPSHQVGWEGTVDKVLKNGFVVDGVPIAKTSAENVEPEDERIHAWETIIDHPIFKECFNTEGTLLDAVRNRLVDLYEMEQTINELKAADAEVRPSLSATPNPMIRLEVLNLTLAHYGDLLPPEKAVDAASGFAAWVEGR